MAIMLYKLPDDFGYVYNHLHQDVEELWYDHLICKCIV